MVDTYGVKSYRIQDARFRIQDARFRIQGIQDVCRIQDSRYESI